MTTYNLDIYSEEHFDFDIFSISCPESIYRVVHEINRVLDIDLQLNELLDYRHKNGEDFYFPVYQYFHESLNIEFNVLPNQTSFQPNEKENPQPPDLFAGAIEQTTWLIPELETTDYFVLIKGDNRYLYNHAVFDALKTIPLLTGLTEIFLEDLKDKKSKGNLLF